MKLLLKSYNKYTREKKRLKFGLMLCSATPWLAFKRNKSGPENVCTCCCCYFWWGFQENCALSFDIICHVSFQELLLSTLRYHSFKKSLQWNFMNPTAIWRGYITHLSWAPVNPPPTGLVNPWCVSFPVQDAHETLEGNIILKNRPVKRETFERFLKAVVL